MLRQCTSTGSFYQLNELSLITTMNSENMLSHPFLRPRVFLKLISRSLSPELVCNAQCRYYKLQSRSPDCDVAAQF
jgi:hypothetical protein